MTLPPPGPVSACVLVTTVLAGSSGVVLRASPLPFRDTSTEVVVPMPVGITSDVLGASRAPGTRPLLVLCPPDHTSSPSEVMRLVPVGVTEVVLAPSRASCTRLVLVPPDHGDSSAPAVVALSLLVGAAGVVLAESRVPEAGPVVEPSLRRCSSTSRLVPVTPAA